MPDYFSFSSLLNSPVIRPGYSKTQISPLSLDLISSYFIRSRSRVIEIRRWDENKGNAWR